MGWSTHQAGPEDQEVAAATTKEDGMSLVGVLFAPGAMSRTITSSVTRLATTTGRKGERKGRSQSTSPTQLEIDIPIFLKHAWHILPDALQFAMGQDSQNSSNNAKNH